MRLVERQEGEPEGESFLQSDFWGGFKAEQGWLSRRLTIHLEGGRAEPLLVLVRPLQARLCFAYVPHGPEIAMPSADRAGFLAELSRSLRPFLPRACLFIRFDPPWFEAESAEDPAWTEARRPAIGLPLHRSVSDVQPPDTVLVDLRPGEEAMLAAMKSKWRYNVRLAEKKGVEVESRGLESIGEFYELYRATSKRDRIALHPQAYYSRLFELAAHGLHEGRAGTPDIRLFIARHEGRALAAIVTLFRGSQAVYLYGASSDEDRNLMPAYALQWAAMRAAKAAGCSSYDLFGIPPTDDSSHPMAGLYRFKTGFGGLIVHRPGSWDYPLIGPLWLLFKSAEALRMWWYKDLRKRIGRAKRGREGQPARG